jgi:ketosteroid isomerase-like protein
LSKKAVTGMPSGSFEEAFDRQQFALAEFMHGNTQPYGELFSRRADATLANPFGGVARGWDEITMHIDRAASYYQDGDVVEIETIASDHSADMGYAIEIERLRARIGRGEVLVDVALRTTTVYRREEAGWTLVHRHADPAVELRGSETLL